MVKFKKITTIFYPLISLLVLLSGCKPESKKSLPRVIHIGKYSATLAWDTQTEEKGTVWFSTEGEQLVSQAEDRKSKNHLITLGGLLPDKVYQYQLSEKAETEFTFKTAPKKESAFRFCLVNQHTSLSIIDSLLPDFIILTGEQGPQRLDLLQELNTRIPVLSENFSFVWGGGLFTGLTSQNRDGLPDSSQGFNVVVSNGAQLVIDSNTAFTLHFTGKNDSQTPSTNKNLKEVRSSGSSVLVEVQGPEIRAAILDSNFTGELPLQLRKTAYSYKKTCVYCRNLLESKQYHKSIDGYKQFIESNTQVSLQDDAFYQIAYIYDHYLFEYAEALTVYKELLQKYPSGRNSQLAEFRINYIEKHADHDFKPLKIFERARLTGLREDSLSSLQSVEEGLKKYPGTTLDIDMKMWLGKTYENRDVEKALGYFQSVYQNAKDSTARYKAQLARGDLFYKIKNYTEAENTYRGLLKAFPSKINSLEIKIHRSVRNYWRQKIHYSALFICLLIPLLVGLWRPAGFKLPSLKNAVLLNGGILLMAGVPFYLYYEFLTPIWEYLIAFGLSISGAIYIVGEYSRKARLILSSKIAVIITSWMLYMILSIILLYVWSNTFHILFVFERLIW